MTKGKVSNFEFYSCTRKVKYANYQSSVDALLDLIARNNDTKEPKRRLHTYHCDICSGWHVGHTTKKFYLAICKEISRELSDGQSDWWPVMAAHKRN